MLIHSITKTDRIIFTATMPAIATGQRDLQILPYYDKKKTFWAWILKLRTEFNFTHTQVLSLWDDKMDYYTFINIINTTVQILQISTKRQRMFSGHP